jgi:hypothetical protein
MAEKALITQLVEKVVSQVLEKHVSQMRQELVQRVLEEVQLEMAGAASGEGAGAADLVQAVSAIHAGTTQKEVLRALLDNTVRYSGRAALFVVKAGAATGWQGRGFDDNESVKGFALDLFSSAPSDALGTQSAVAAPVAEMDAKFIAQFGAPAKDKILLLPLRLKDKVAAVVYADGGHAEPSQLDSAALELLVAATSAWLEVASLRKAAAKDGPAEHFEASSVAVQTVSSYSDPFAGHVPKHAEEGSVEVPAAVAAEPAPAAAMAAAAPARAADAFAQLSPEDAEVHRKAQRFARLLMDEIKLYNQAKVAEGRKNKDLYDRLRDDIEKSRSTYTKRYGQSAAAGADYFTQELVRSLAEDDLSILGSNYHPSVK